MYKFEGLKVWQEGLVFVKLAYLLCSKLPSYERSGLADQLRRASTSILLNVAEGTGAGSGKDFLRFLKVSRKSLYETIAILKLIEFLHKLKIVEAEDQLNIVGKLLNGLIRKVESES